MRVDPPDAEHLDGVLVYNAPRAEAVLFDRDPERGARRGAGSWAFWQGGRHCFAVFFRADDTATTKIDLSDRQPPFFRRVGHLLGL